MWAALKSDLSEFVSGVAEETEHVLKIDDREFDAEVALSDLQCAEETYALPLDESNEDVQAFLDEFSIDKHTEEIAQLLQDNPDTIAVFFEEMVPTQISYALFWQRYFFRSHEDRLKEQFKAARETTPKKAKGTGITNLFGGALSVVSASLDKADQHVPMSPFIDGGTVAPRGAGGGIFGNGGRPPFVMNTAVDEDDDDDDEEEDEEELGWDDDDDDLEVEEEEEEEDDDAANMSEEITFSGGSNTALDKLSEQLAQALSERDALKETVSLLTREISSLKEGKVDDEEIRKLKMSLFEKDAELAALKASLDDTHEDGPHNERSAKDAAKISSLEREVERLKQELEQAKADTSKAEGKMVETENKLTSAEKALADTKDELEAGKDKMSTIETELIRVQEAARNDKETLISSLELAKVETESLRRALEKDDDLSAAEQEARETARSLETELSAMKTESEEKCAQIRLLEQQIEELRHDDNGDLAVAEQEARDMAKALDLELNVTKEALAESQKMARQFQLEVEKLKHEMEAVKVNASVAVHAAVQAEHRLSPCSEDTGVKIEVVAPPTTGEEEEEGWGDDWGDDDEL